MSTDRLRPGSSIAELLRGLSVGAATPKRAGTSPSSAVSTDRTAPRDPAVLRRDLALLVAEVDLDAEPAVRALRRPVVRRILTWEFGEAFIEHPDYPQAIANIESAMDADPAVAGQFLAMLRRLQRKRPG